MALNEGKMEISYPVVPVIKLETDTADIRHGVVGLKGDRTIPSPLAHMFYVMSIKIICSDHKKQPP